MISSMADDRVSLSDQEIRARLAIRKELSAMTAEEREMDRAMKAFEEDADQAKRYIEAEWRTECWGHEPERPPAWKVTDSTHASLPSGHGSSAARPDRDRRSVHP